MWYCYCKSDSDCDNATVCGRLFATYIPWNIGTTKYI